MADTACMLPKRDRADMKLLNIINGANCKFSFFCNRKADNKTKTDWDKRPLTDKPNINRGKQAHMKVHKREEEVMSK